MDTDKLLTGTELYNFFVNFGAPSFDGLADEAAVLESEGLNNGEIVLALEFACCIAGLYQYIGQYVPAEASNGEIRIFFSGRDVKKQLADCLSGPIDGYMIYAEGFAEIVNNKIMELLDYDRIISQESYLVAQAICLVRRQLLKRKMIKPIGRKDYAKTPDPALQSVIRLFDENFTPTDRTFGSGEQYLKTEFDIMVMENLAISKIEWGISLDELVSLLKTEIRQ
jgi:hypothetical protein